MRDLTLARDQVIDADRLEGQVRATEWLPSRIFDTHAHNWLEEHVLSVPPRAATHIINSYRENSIEDSLNFRRLFFPGRDVRTLRFAHAMPGVDHKAVNDWLQAELPAWDKFALFGLQTDVDYTLSALERLRPAALKQYYFITEPIGKEIRDVFDARVLDLCQQFDIPIICHLPTPLPESLGDVLGVVAEFPGLRLVLAHAGVALSYTVDLENAYDLLGQLPNVYFDTALVDDAGVLESLLRHVPYERVCFGSDEPLSCIRARTYLHPSLGPRLIPKEPYGWTDQAEYAEFGFLGASTIQWHWAALDALRHAVSTLPVRDQERAINAIFWDVGISLYA